LTECGLDGGRVLVTGASGFIGGHLSSALARAGAIVVPLVRGDRDSLRRQLSVGQPDVIVHLAANKDRGTSLASYRSSYESNLLSPLDLIEASMGCGTLQRFVCIGSCEEYGQHTAPFHEDLRERPVTAYGVGKLAFTHLIEALVRAGQLPAVVLRPSIVYGPGQAPEMFVPAMIVALLSGRRFPMTAGRQTRDLLFVSDLVDAILRAIVSPATTECVFNIGSGHSVRIAELARLVAELVGADRAELLDIGALDYRPGDAMDYSVASERALEHLGWRASTELQDGLRRTVDYYREAARPE